MTSDRSAVSAPPPATAPASGRAPAAPGFAAIVLPCVALFLAMLNLTLVVSGLKELVVDELGGTVADSALFFTVEMIAYLVFAPVWGAVSDRVGRRRPLVVAGFAASGLLYFAYLGLHSVAALLALRFVQGAASIAGWSTAMALLFDHADDSAGRLGRARLAGFAGASLILGVGLGAPIGGILTSRFGPRAPLATAGALFLVVAVLALFMREAPAARARPRLGEVARALARTPRLLLPWSLYAMERFTVGLFVVVFPHWRIETVSASAALRGRELALFLLPFAFCQLATYRLSRRFGPFALLAAGCLAYGAAFATLPAAGARGIHAVLVLLGVTAALVFPPTLALTAEWTAPESRASALAGFNVAGSLGFALGPVAGAWAQGLWGFAGAFRLAAFAAFAGAVAALLARLRRASARSPD